MRVAEGDIGHRNLGADLGSRVGYGDLSSVSAEPPMARKNGVRTMSRLPNFQPVADGLKGLLLALFGPLPVADVQCRRGSAPKSRTARAAQTEESMPPLSDHQRPVPVEFRGIVMPNPTRPSATAPR